MDKESIQDYSQGGTAHHIPWLLYFVGCAIEKTARTVYTVAESLEDKTGPG